MSERTLSVDGRTITISNWDKVFFPEAGLTKGDLVRYYQRIAGAMLPHLRDRPLTMQRFPDGIDEGGFYQKEVPDHFPEWIRRVPIMVEEEGQEQPQLVCDDAATLLYLADQGCVTPHVWLSRADQLHHPDKLIFDLDPPDDAFGPIRAAARSLREVLEAIGLAPFVMTTGSRGLHVVVPLDRSAGFDTVRDFAHDLARLLARRAPDDLTVEIRKAKRRGRLFLDYLRNAYGQNAVAPYAVRARPGAPIATPLDWDELGGSDMHAQYYTVENIFRRLGQKDDPWAAIWDQARSLEKPRQELDALRDD